MSGSRAVLESLVLKANALRQLRFLSSGPLAGAPALSGRSSERAHCHLHGDSLPYVNDERPLL